MKNHLEFNPLFASTALVVAIIFVINLWGPSIPFHSNVLPAAVSIMPDQPAASITPPIPAGPVLYKYIEVTDGCGPYYQGTCINLRSGPGQEFPVVSRLRNGMVLKVADTAYDSSGRMWYRIAQDSEIKYPERVTSDWYVLADAVHLIYDDGDHRLTKANSTTTQKRIVVDVSEEMLYAYDGDELFMQAPISTGLEFTPTSRGTFTVFKMTPSRYMQGPIPGVSDQEYDLPGVPWNLYFTWDGSVIHGAYWHDHFGEPWSHGCVNLSPENAKKLYEWAEIGIKVKIQN